MLKQLIKMQTSWSCHTTT